MANINPFRDPPQIIPSQPLSQKVAEARVRLLKNLQEQLDDLLANELKPQDKGVPFIGIKGEPPQIQAIKKMINCLYYSEKALIVWEGVEKKGTLEMAMAAPQGVWAINELHKSLAILDNYFYLKYAQLL